MPTAHVLVPAKPDELALQYRPLAAVIARGYYWPGAGPDDVRQEALLALLKAARAWDGRGRFPSFARLAINRHLIDCLRRATLMGKRRDMPKPELVALEDVHVSPFNLEELVLQRERLREALRPAA